MTSVSARSPQVKSAMRTLDIIEFVVGRTEPVQAQEVATALGIPMSSMSYLLSTLCDRDYLVRDGRRYSPGPGLLRLRTPETALSLEARLAPMIRAVRTELDETVSLFGLDGWEARVLVTEASGQSLRYAIEPGARRPLHALAGGKALLSLLPDDALARYFRESARDRFTTHTLVDEADLRAEIDRVRTSGFAEAREESQSGICSLARPIALPGQPICAVSIAVPAVRYTDRLRAQAQALLRHW
ncbi:IclR family transcriptional regulator [Novosphingobium flavum]|uniref:IclR family transcriptional regulator n=1 Tax=Novosphingobium aerophilum TaxID=2839843 RepID=A0A7X1F767_9SPHN|nr:IclR family transcriptional regulator [Novosphingobium aerophilum]MBC2651632.1 IclR family transcriptional regulator [Novosphingobium aerophilum]MBC2661456.1 IclR family transcriptional regulator [Novosphingobium aerophilum]